VKKSIYFGGFGEIILKRLFLLIFITDVMQNFITPVFRTFEKRSLKPLILLG
jgi:hypothetical protein